MKYSGVEWIGNIPDDWGLVRLKDICVNKKEIAGEKSSKYERLALTLNGVIKRAKDDQEGLQPKEFDTYQILEANDFVFKMIDLQNISTSRVGLSPYTGLVSPAYIRFAPKTENQFNHFIYYYLLSLWHNCVYNNIAGDGVRSALNATDIGNLLCPYPIQPIQKKIVNYLNKKTSEIDSLIEIENKQIEKLKEYKQAIITETVTKGLNKNVPMIDSGVEWIGKMPANWKRIKLLNLFEDIGSGTTPKGDDYYTDGTINWIQSGDINGGFLTSCSSAVNNYAIKEFSTLKVYQAPFLIMAMYGGSVGHLSISKIDGCCNQACCVMRNPKCNFDFAFYSLQAARNYLLKNAIGGGQPNISQTIIKSIWFCNPPMNEQEEIASFLNEQCSRIDVLISVKQRKIEHLNEYKKSLIYEYVTGKKEAMA